MDELQQKFNISMNELQKKFGNSVNQLQQKFDNSLKIYQDAQSNSRDKNELQQKSNISMDELQKKIDIMNELQQKLNISMDELQQKLDNSLKIYQDAQSNSRDKILFYRRKIVLYSPKLTLVYLVLYANNNNYEARICLFDSHTNSVKQIARFRNYYWPHEVATTQNKVNSYVSYFE